MKSRFISSLLILLVVCLQISADNVAKITGKLEYATLREAVTAAETGDTITMIADCEVTDGVIKIIGKVITLDLNGKKIISNFDTDNCSLFNIQTGGTGVIDGELTITDTSKEQTGEITCVDQDRKILILIKTGGKLTINAGRFSSPETTTRGCCLISVSGGENACLIINGGVFTITRGTDETAYGVIDNSKETTINGGTIINSCNSTDFSARAIHNSGTLKVFGGNITSNGDAVWSSKSATFVLGNGGNIVGNIAKNGSDYVVDEYILSDDADFNLKNTLDVNKISYNRGNSNPFGTICLPFVPDEQSSITYYTMRDCEDGALVLEKANEIKANTPYIYYTENGKFNVCRTEKTTLDANAEAGTEKKENGWELKGVYKKTSIYVDENEGYDAQNTSNILEPNSYYIKDGGFCKANGFFSIKPFRAYFTAPNESSSNRYEIGIYDEIMALQSLVDVNAEIIAIYNMGGVALPMLQKGINIVTFSNGETRKVIVK